MTEAVALPRPTHAASAGGDDGSWRYFPELLAKPVPRYTSYPTAAEFHDGVGEADQQRGLSAIADDDTLSLYLHIPFCREICWYCGCNTGRANRQHRLGSYLSHLQREIDLVAEALDGRGKVARIAFGGGSPNAISADEFIALASAVKSRLSVTPDAVWSVEIDPRTFDHDFAAALSELGVTRASLGVQTFDPTLQQAIGRIQPDEVIERSVTLLREAGVTSLNFDLMYGLPAQDRPMLIESIRRSEVLGADRLAVFGYAHVPHLIPRQRRIDASRLPDAAERFRAAEAAYHYLAAAGWQSVGFDHFARARDPLALAARERRVRRNFQGFTDDSCDVLIGLGASAISRLPGALVQNDKNNGSYADRIASGQLAGNRGIRLSQEDERRALIIERLLCAGAVDLSGTEVADARTALTPFIARSLVQIDASTCRLSADAMPYARTIAARFDQWRAASTGTLSSAV
jgi:oxygen-independent coproporphyrinogen-3 oxidase